MQSPAAVLDNSNTFLQQDRGCGQINVSPDGDGEGGLGALVVALVAIGIIARGVLGGG